MSCPAPYPSAGEGLWCWSCARRFVPVGKTQAAADISWFEGLCGRNDCPALP